MAHCAKEGYNSAIGASAHHAPSKRTVDWRKKRGGLTKSKQERINPWNEAPPAIRGGAHVTGAMRSRGQCVPSSKHQRLSAFMDFASDVGVRHSVVLSNLNIQHSVDFSPATVSIVRELRFCVIAIVVGWTTTRVVSALLNRRPSDDRP